jgi:hypothetical protein
MPLSFRNFFYMSAQQMRANLMRSTTKDTPLLQLQSLGFTALLFGVVFPALALIIFFAEH